MKFNSNIDELLNAYIDGELSPRQLTEVQRLIANDVNVREKLNELRQIKAMVNSLPTENAPEELFGEIKASLERTFLLSHEKPTHDKIKGVMHLFFRKVLTAAAMLALVGLLGYVVYTIIQPDAGTTAPFAQENIKQPTESVIEQTPAIEVAQETPITVEPPVADAEKATAVDTVAITQVIAAEDFNAVLELKTANLLAADAFIKRTLMDGGLESTVSEANNVTTFVINSSPAKIAGFAEQLYSLWPQLDSSSLTVAQNNTDKITVNKVGTAQIVQIFKQQNTAETIQIAKDFAASNSAFSTGGEETKVATEQQKTDEPTPAEQPIPKPVLTSGEKDANQNAPVVEGSRKVSFTIVLTGV